MPLLTLVDNGRMFKSSGTKYDSFTISNGYGNVSSAGVSVTRGVTAVVQISLRVEGVVDADFQEWKSDVKSSFTNEEWSTLEENYAGAGFAGGFFAGAFGILFGGGSANHYRNEHEQQVTTSEESQQQFLDKTRNMQTTDAVVSGQFFLTGLSDIPTTASVYIETTTIKFEDGTTLSVMNTSDAVAADQSGYTDGVTSTGGPLSITPLATVASLFKMISAVKADGGAAVLRSSDRCSMPPEAHRHVLRSAEDGNVRFLDYTLLGVLTLTGTATFLPPGTNVSVKLFGATVMELNGSLETGISGSFDVGFGSGTVTLYLKNNREVWVKAYVYVIGTEQGSLDVELFSF